MVDAAHQKQVLFFDTAHLVSALRKNPAFLHFLLFESIHFTTLLPKYSEVYT